MPSGAGLLQIDIKIRSFLSFGIFHALPPQRSLLRTWCSIASKAQIGEEYIGLKGAALWRDLWHLQKHI